MKIIQILMAPENSTYQGCMFGLGDNGTVYVLHKEATHWEIYIGSDEVLP